MLESELYILRITPYRETSVLLDCVTRDSGPIKAIMRGARSPKSKSRGFLHLFFSLFAVYSEKKELKFLNKIEPAKPLIFLEGNALAAGFYLNELLQKLWGREDPNPNLYALYENTLIALRNGENLAYTIRIFEKKLLDYLGYGLPLTSEAGSAKPIQKHQAYTFIPEQGFSQVKQLTLQKSTPIFSGETLLFLANETKIFKHPHILKEAKYLLQSVLNTLLGKQRIYSKELLQSTQ